MPVTMTKDEAKQLLREHDLRATSPRLAVLTLLAEMPGPLSHSEVLEKLGKTDWDQATIYRNLVRLTEAGLAHVVTRAGGMDRYELVGAGHETTHNHPHFVCTDCGEVSCLPGGASAKVEVPEHWQRAVQSATVQLQGTCPDCLNAPQDLAR